MGRVGVAKRSVNEIILFSLLSDIVDWLGKVSAGVSGQGVIPGTPFVIY